MSFRCFEKTYFYTILAVARPAQGLRRLQEEVPLLDYIAQCDSDFDIDEIKAKICVTDYEKGISNAIKSVFPNFSVYGCMFHWKQAIKFKVDKIGLAKFYASRCPPGKIFRRFVSMVMALTYVHPAHVKHYYKALAKNMRQKFADRTSVWFQNKTQVGLFFC